MIPVRALVTSFVTLTILFATGITSGADPYPTERDRIMSEAATFHNLEWYCYANNIYSGLTGRRCEYSTPGWQGGMAYKWGGYDTVDGFLDDMANGLGAGDTDSSGVYSDVSGVDCSGYVSRIWESGRYATASFYRATDEIDWDDLRMGDALNRAGSHIRLFIRWENANTLWVYESTTGVDPGRVTRRTLSRSSFNSYIPVRYHIDATNRVRIDPEPTILWIQRTGTQAIDIPFDGEADSGFRLEHSLDGDTWSTLRNETQLGASAFHAGLTGLALNTDHFFRVVAVNSGGLTDPSDTLAVRLDGNGDPRILIVDGMDRWRTNGNAGHTFLLPIAQTLGRLGFAYESCSNEMVATGMVNLEDYEAVIWLVGEDSTEDESISRGEQFHFENYLEAGGCVFLSGSEIAWDLDHRGSGTRFQDPTDASFMLDYLGVDYLSDGSGGNGYLAQGKAGTDFENLTVRFDDGTHGTYDVTYPDAYTPQVGAVSILTYPSTGETAAAALSGTFGGGMQEGHIVTMGFGLETVHDDAERDALMGAVLEFFGQDVKSMTERILEHLLNVMPHESECDLNDDGTIDICDLVLSCQ